eukprot:1455934-Pyramimonas_sp.AAC.1
MGQRRRGCWLGARGWPLQGPCEADSRHLEASWKQVRCLTGPLWRLAGASLGHLGAPWRSSGPLGGHLVVSWGGRGGWAIAAPHSEAKISPNSWGKWRSTAEATILARGVDNDNPLDPPPSATAPAGGAKKSDLRGSRGARVGREGRGKW